MICESCGKDLPVDDFNKKNKHDRHAICINCKKDSRTQSRIEDERQHSMGFFVNDRCWLTGAKYS